MNTTSAKFSRTPSARALYTAQDSILTQWSQRVRSEIKTAEHLSDPIIINTVPLFLEGLSDALDEDNRIETASENSNMPQEHGGERARVTHFGPEQILQEYQILREVVCEEVAKLAPLTKRDEVIIQKSFDKAIQESMNAFFLVHGRIREQFIATLTHDLRNPISAVKMAADLIVKTIEDPARSNLIDSFKLVSELAGRITKNVKRCDRMIQDLLNASVVQIGERLPVHITEGDIKDIVTDAVSELTNEERQRLSLDVVSHKGHWDLEALQRSIENLIGNAFKYGAENKPITVEVKVVHERVMVSVHNEGNPIPAENRETLFQVFRRAEAAKQSQKRGWGIGLALARSTAEHMGGSLGIQSSNEKGTTFTMDIPSDARPFIHSPTTASN